MASLVPSRNKLFTHMATFRGPDMIFQPGSQGQVIGIAAQQTHGSMAMGIDQPGHHNMIIELLDCAASKRLAASAWG